MLGVQLDFDGNKLVVCNNVPIGVMVDDSTEDCLGVLRIIGNEYTEQVRLIQAGLRGDADKNNWYVCQQVYYGELLITVKREVVDIKEILAGYCFPMKTDGLLTTYVKCKKVYNVKQSAIYVKRELIKLGVIK